MKTVNGTKFVLTDHAYDRIKERMGLNKKAADRMSVTAYYKGARHKDLTGKLKEYVLNSMEDHKTKGDDPHVYGEYIYCFVHGGVPGTGQHVVTLVTVMTVPNDLKDQAIKIQKRNNKVEEKTSESADDSEDS